MTAFQKLFELHLSLAILWPFPLSKILLACCLVKSSHLKILAAQIGMSCIVSVSHLSLVCFTWSTHSYLSSGSLRKQYRCSPWCYSLRSSATIMQTVVTRLVLPYTSRVKHRPHRKCFKVCPSESLYVLNGQVLESNLFVCCLWTYIYKTM